MLHIVIGDPPKLSSNAHLMNDDSEEEGEAPTAADDAAGMAGMDDGAVKPSKKGKAVAGGKKHPVPPQFLAAIRARRAKGK